MTLKSYFFFYELSAPLRRIIALMIVGLVCTAYTEEAKPDLRTQFRPDEIWPDNNGVPINAHGGGVLLHEGVYHWYGEHKLEDKIELTESKSPENAAGGGVHGYSSTDLLNWKDEGLVLSVEHENPNSDIAYGCVLERPKVLYNENNRNFVMFFKLFPRGVGYKVGYVGVALADSATGPFTYSHKFIGGDPKVGSGDFALFKDDDGSAYHICTNMKDRDTYLVKLTDDYQTPSGPYSAMEGIEHSTEAPAIFKRDGNYYLLGSDSKGWRPTAARSFSADTLTGKWT